MTNNFKYAQLQPFALAGGGAVTGATSIILQSMTDIDGNALSMSGTFGTKGFGTIDPGNGALEEQISFTGLTNNTNGTVTLSGVSSVLFVSPYTETSGLAKTHAGAAPFVISNTAGFYNEMVSKNDDATITATYTFTSPNYPQMDSATPYPTDPKQFATKGYADSLAIAGAPNATTVVQGLVQLPTQAQVDAGTATGSTGASLTPTPALLRSKLLSDYVVDTGAANAYVITPSPVISAYATGQIFSFKAAHANTTASTLNVNAVGAKNIFKVDGATALASGDISAGQIIFVEYDGTQFQMLNPVANAPASVPFLNTQRKFGGTGADGALSITSGTTTINLGNVAVVVKNYTSISITGTGVLNFSNPNTNGTIVILKSQGDVTLTSSATPMINASGVGAAAGAQVTASAGNAGSNGYSVLFVSGSGGGGSADGGTGGTAGARGTGQLNVVSQYLQRYPQAFVGAGAGSGSGSSAGGSPVGGAGGAGGAGLIIECLGAWNFTTTSGISVAGAAGSVGTDVGGGGRGGGGGGGGGGFFLALYNTLTASTGTVTTAGGTGGNKGTLTVNNAAGGGGGGNPLAAGSAGTVATTASAKTGGDGAAGISVIASNTEYF